MTRLLVIVAVFIVGHRAFAEQPAPDSSNEKAQDRVVRDIIERSVPFIQREGEQWIETRKCNSCHQIPFMVWSLNASADHGLAVDREQLLRWNNWARDWENFRGRDQVLKDDQEKVLLTSPDEADTILRSDGGRQIPGRKFGHFPKLPLVMRFSLGIMAKSSRQKWGQIWPGITVGNGC